jgi:hypothetical protein
MAVFPQTQKDQVETGRAISEKGVQEVLIFDCGLQWGREIRDGVNMRRRDRNMVK